jgi:hypothetical protein
MRKFFDAETPHLILIPGPVYLQHLQEVLKPLKSRRSRQANHR